MTTSISQVVAALQRGDLTAAWAGASQLPRGRIALDHALALVALLSLDEPPVERYGAAVDRWLERARHDHPELPIEQLGRLLDGLPDLAAVTELQVLCEHHCWPVALTTLD